MAKKLTMEKKIVNAKLQQIKKRLEEFIFKDCSEDDDGAMHKGLDYQDLYKFRDLAEDTRSSISDDNQNFFSKLSSLNNFHSECEPGLISDLIDFYLYMYPELKKL